MKDMHQRYIMRLSSAAAYSMSPLRGESQVQACALTSVHAREREREREREERESNLHNNEMVFVCNEKLMRYV